jgi:hypothetical protein
LYVDDLFITGAEDLIAECKLGLASEFEMSDIGLMHYFLGMEVWQEEGHIFLGQGKYAADILSRFQMEDCRRSGSGSGSGKRIFSKISGSGSVSGAFFI